MIIPKMQAAHDVARIECLPFMPALIAERCRAVKAGPLWALPRRVADSYSFNCRTALGKVAQNLFVCGR